MRFEASRVVFRSLSCYKELKLTTNRVTGRTLRGLLIQMQNISLRSSGMSRKQNFEIVFGFKSDTAVLTFTFHFLSLLLFSLFLSHFFFSLAGHLVGFILVGGVFRKAFRILGLGERKGRWAMEQDFHGDFQVNITWFFASFSCVLDWIVLIVVWFERSLHSAQVSEESCPWPLKLMTSQRVERTWIRTGSYGRFRGEWVKLILLYFCFCLCRKNFRILRMLVMSFWC